MIRKVIIRTIIIDPDSVTPPEIIGQLIDDGVSEPYGTNEMVDSMLTADRRDRFDRYYLGYSNGFTFESVPDIAVTKPAVWEQFLQWAWGEGRGQTQAQKVAKLGEMAGA